jgi:hypothetical protein
MARECGSCTACCELLEVIELKKPRGVLCQHCTIGKGCAIHETRPEVCRDYECGWLAHDYIPDELRPDRCGFILDTTHDKRVMLITSTSARCGSRSGASHSCTSSQSGSFVRASRLFSSTRNTPQEIRVWPCVGVTKDRVLEIPRQDRLARQQRRRSRASQVAVEQEA